MDGLADADFSRQRIVDYKNLFKRAEAPRAEAVDGRYEAEFIGPAWLRYIAPKLLPLGGLPGWFGKSFAEGEKAINLLRKGNELVEAVPMCRRFCASGIDGQSALVLSYDRRAPLGCRLLIDEFRALDEDTLLGLTVVNLPLIRSFTLPFLLKRVL